MRQIVAGFLVMLFASCSYVIPLSPRLRRAADENRSHALALTPGMDIAQVRAVMGKDPERRDVRVRFDGKTVEVWSYATDYVRRLDTTITFLDGRVQEIKTLPWYEED